MYESSPAAAFRSLYTCPKRRLTFMRIYSLFAPTLLALTLLALPGAAQDSNVSITWVGQACFVIRSEGGPTVVTDPPVPSVGYTLPAIAADAVTITHNHTDHNNSAGVGGKFTLVDGRPVTSRQQITAAGLAFTLIPGFHDNQNGAQRGQNTIIRWNQSGLKIAHFGDFGQDQLTEAQLADLRDLDLMFFPAGGFFTVTPEQAAQFVRELKPKVAILMHYKTALGGPAQLAGLPDAPAPFSPLVYQPATVVVRAGNLPASTEVWVMEPASDAAAVSAAFTPGAAVAPGSLVSVFGKFTASQTNAAAGFPLPRKLGDTEVLIDGKAAPLIYISPGQINLQLSSTQAAGQVLADMRVGGQTVARAPVTVVPNAPGIFVVANQDGRVNTPALAAHRGQVLQIFGTGQGAVSPAVEDGAAAPSQPVSSSLALPNVFLEGRQLAVQFSGLAPGFAGLWQLNVLIPRDAPTGPALALTVVNGLTSNRVSVTVVD
jgi:uncharacterized protein (TIGR03437 family)